MAVGYMKGKSAIQISNEKRVWKRGKWGKNFWARGYYVSTVGADEKIVREYVEKQKYLEKAKEQQ